MIPSDAHAFRAGLRPALVGAYFRIAELMAEHVEDPSDAVRAFVRGELQRVRETGRSVVESVRQVEADARLCGFEPPAPPRFPADFGDWWDEVHGGFAHAAGARRHVHTAGHALGMGLVALNVLTVVLRVRMEDPEGPVLAQRTHALLQELDFVRSRCAETARADLPEDVRRLLERVRDELESTASLVEAGQSSTRGSDMARMGAAVQDGLRDLDARVSTLSAALHGRSVGEA